MAVVPTRVQTAGVGHYCQLSIRKCHVLCLLYCLVSPGLNCLPTHIA